MATKLFSTGDGKFAKPLGREANPINEFNNIKVDIQDQLIESLKAFKDKVTRGGNIIDYKDSPLNQQFAINLGFFNENDELTEIDAIMTTFQNDLIATDGAGLSLAPTIETTGTNIRISEHPDDELKEIQSTSLRSFKKNFNAYIIDVQPFAVFSNEALNAVYNYNEFNDFGKLALEMVHANLDISSNAVYLTAINKAINALEGL